MCLVEVGVINYKRAQRQFGRFLTTNSELINNGIGMELKSPHHEAPKFIKPTLTFDDEITLNVAGNMSTFYSKTIISYIYTYQQEVFELLGLILYLIPFDNHYQKSC